MASYAWWLVNTIPPCSRFLYLQHLQEDELAPWPRRDLLRRLEEGIEYISDDPLHTLRKTKLVEGQQQREVEDRKIYAGAHRGMYEPYILLATTEFLLRFAEWAERVELAIKLLVHLSGVTWPAEGAHWHQRLRESLKDIDHPMERSFYYHEIQAGLELMQTMRNAAKRYRTGTSVHLHQAVERNLLDWLEEVDLVRLQELVVEALNDELHRLEDEYEDDSE